MYMVSSTVFVWVLRIKKKKNKSYVCIKARGALTLERGMGMCCVHDPLFSGQSPLPSPPIDHQCAALVPPFSIFKKFLHFQPCFGQNLSSLDPKWIFGSENCLWGGLNIQGWLQNKTAGWLAISGCLVVAGFFCSKQQLPRTGRNCQSTGGWVLKSPNKN